MSNAKLGKHEFTKEDFESLGKEAQKTVKDSGLFTDWGKSNKSENTTKKKIRKSTKDKIKKIEKENKVMRLKLNGEVIPHKKSLHEKLTSPWNVDKKTFKSNMRKNKKLLKRKTRSLWRKLI